MTSASLSYDDQFIAPLIPFAISHGPRTWNSTTKIGCRACHSLFDRLVNGARPMASLVFPNLVVLALVGIWAFFLISRKQLQADRG
jgi:hypothetical protein